MALALLNPETKLKVLNKFFVSTLSLLVAIFIANTLQAQVLFSSGLYSQHFNTLAATNAFWTNNVTLPGWYLAKTGVDVTNTLVGTGSGSAGAFYSFGSAAADRALGSLASTGNNYAYGLRFTNDTALAVTNLTISYTGEQWRNGGNTSMQTLTFSYGLSSAPITNAASGTTWVNFPALNFNSPTVGPNASALDGNNATNRQVFSNVALTGVSVLPGQEFFLRWLDADDSGTDHALAIDDLIVAFQSTTNTGETNPPPVVFTTNSSVTLMTYNVKGNGATDWSTNAPQVQAIGRQLVYLNPDIITFNEIPYTNTWQMANWVAAYLPGYFLATNSGTDGSIRSVIVSRHPINRSKSWLARSDLNPFGYTTTNSSADNFTRDLFEAEINVPNWPLPLHVFTTHLKSSGSGYAEAANKRAAEAAAITNFFATNLLALYPGQPFILSGDMNESDTNTSALQRLVSAPTTLRLTNPTNPVSDNISTYSIQGSLSERIDYIFPCGLLASNIVTSQVFRSDLLYPLPPNLNAADDITASDHLPVLMTFANPFNPPFRLLSFSRTNQNITLKWESATNRLFAVETSTNFSDWMPLATNLFATGTNFIFSTNNVSDPWRYFRIYRIP